MWCVDARRPRPSEAGPRAIAPRAYRSKRRGRSTVEDTRIEASPKLAARAIDEGTRPANRAARRDARPRSGDDRRPRCPPAADVATARSDAPSFCARPQRRPASSRAFGGAPFVRWAGGPRPRGYPRRARQRLRRTRPISQRPVLRRCPLFSKAAMFLGSRDETGTSFRVQRSASPAVA